MTSQTTNARQLTAAERRRAAVELRRSGLSYECIGQRLGISYQAAHMHVKKAMEKLAKETREDAQHLRAMELERLDLIQLGAWQSATSGNVRSIRAMLSIMERRAKLLGLDAPQKIAPTTPEGDEAAPPGVLILPETAPGVEEWLKRYRDGT